MSQLLWNKDPYKSQVIKNPKKKYMHNLLNEKWMLSLNATYASASLHFYLFPNVVKWFYK